MFLLLSAGIDAFFSGCLTTTVDSLFPARATAFRGGGAVGVVDLPAKAAGKDARDVRVFTHQSDDNRYARSATASGRPRPPRGLPARLQRAVTGRLHAYLPLTTLGVPVEFRTGSPGDVRFAGLTSLTIGDPALEAMRAGLRDLISSTFETVLSGADEGAVYARWRELTRDRVADAKARFEAPVVERPTTVDVAAAATASRAGSRRYGPHDAVDPATVTDIVVAYDPNITLPGRRPLRIAGRQRLRPAPAVGAGSRPDRGLPGLGRRGLPGGADHVPAVRPDHVRRRWRPPVAHPGADRRSPRWTGCSCRSCWPTSIAWCTSTSTR